MHMGHDGQIVMIRVDVITYIVAELPYSIFLDSNTLFSASSLTYEMLR